MTTHLPSAHHAPVTARRMAEAAAGFLESLTEAQRAVAHFPFAGPERYAWDYRPGERQGLRLINMTQAQQEAALTLFDLGLSARGGRQARAIMALETILREHERIDQRVNRWVRDPELYYVSLFGEPGGAAPWGWRANGHHLALHYTIVDRELVAPTPLFFGANPAQVRHGPQAGQRTLPAEEDLARTLVRSLEPAQKASFRPTAPADILTDRYRIAYSAVVPPGIAYAELGGEQRAHLVRLLRHYVERTAEELARNAWVRVEQAGLESVRFTWAGPEEPGQGHYYALRGPHYLIEYDNTQNGANHVHSVWRDFNDDWGEDLLAAHYAVARR